MIYRSDEAVHRHTTEYGNLVVVLLVEVLRSTRDCVWGRWTFRDFAE